MELRHSCRRDIGEKPLIPAWEMLQWSCGIPAAEIWGISNVSGQSYALQWSCGIPAAEMWKVKA